MRNKLHNFINNLLSFSGRIWRTSGILCILCGLFAESTAAFVLYIVSIMAVMLCTLHLIKSVSKEACIKAK